MYNLYGVTEAAVVSTYHRITGEDVRRDAPVPIGRALPNQRAYLLDDQGRAVPSGATGELCVAGPAVAVGYHNREELTARRFGVEPVAPGERLYRTGDLARELPGGALQHLGRADTQVKIRGYRVELGEIESVLAAHPAVRTAVAITRADGSGAARLLAYVVPANGAVEIGELRSFAAQRLPEHMVPSAIGQIDRIPTTVGGKVDTRALPELSVEQDSDADLVEPRTAMERALAEVIGELVGTTRIGVYDRFAYLGLHSAHLMRLMTVIRSRWGVSLPLRELYVAPNLEALAQLVEREQA
nr:hypothetical protein GCM10020241_63780 [Streptoalloteichus tenebrarius]